MPMTREQLREATRQRVLHAADILFQDRGYGPTTVRDIATAAEVSVGTVMAAGDKSSLLVQVFDEMVSAVHEQRRDIDAATQRASTCVDRLELLVRPFIALFAGSPDLARTYASILVSGAHSSALLTELAESLIWEFEATIAARGCVVGHEARSTAQALHAAYVGALFSWSASGVSKTAEITQRLRGLFDSIVRCEEHPE